MGCHFCGEELTWIIGLALPLRIAFDWLRAKLDWRFRDES